ncbi:hypothetical protein HU200_016862 [Digitaria exilis]|uniref:Uncharacterized protein n=1 Tax=Digitaria exilis TaxID=1010633 RepID=A0A835F7V3_9POAL|nr:hypothetical protein HU200_016862 [Digitaria exilis]
MVSLRSANSVPVHLEKSIW